jgi:hypothetical protein
MTMHTTSTEPTLEEFWKDVRPERLPPAEDSPERVPYNELLELINSPTKIRETLVNEYLVTSEGRKKLFESCIMPGRDIIQAGGPKWNQILTLSVITRVLLASDGTENIDISQARELILGLQLTGRDLARYDPSR